MTKMKKFNKEEKRKFMIKKHIKDHLFEYILDFVGPIVLTLFILYLCEAKDIWYGILLAMSYSLGKTIWNIRNYIKD